MKTREEIITSMCYTWRHDYGLTKHPDPGGYTFPFEAGMTPDEQKFLWHQMAQIFDNDIAPHMETKFDIKQIAKELFYELEGVIIDTEQGDGFDEVCLETVKRVQSTLARLK